MTHVFWEKRKLEVAEKIRLLDHLDYMLIKKYAGISEEQNCTMSAV